MAMITLGARCLKLGGERVAPECGSEHIKSSREMRRERYGATRRYYLCRGWRACVRTAKSVLQRLKPHWFRWVYVIA